MFPLKKISIEIKNISPQKKVFEFREQAVIRSIGTNEILIVKSIRRRSNFFGWDSVIRSRVVPFFPRLVIILFSNGLLFLKIFNHFNNKLSISGLVRVDRLLSIITKSNRWLQDVIATSVSIVKHETVSIFFKFIFQFVD